MVFSATGTENLDEGLLIQIFRIYLKHAELEFSHE